MYSLLIDNDLLFFFYFYVFFEWNCPLACGEVAGEVVRASAAIVLHYVADFEDFRYQLRAEKLSFCIKYCIWIQVIDYSLSVTLCHIGEWKLIGPTNCFFQEIGQLLQLVIRPFKFQVPNNDLLEKGAFMFSKARKLDKMNA